MKYYVANFDIECADELLQPARELLSAAACEAGFEAFEDTDNGIAGYVQRQLYDKEALDAAIADYMPEGTQVTYNIEEVPDQDWNQGWEDQGFEPIGVSDHLVIYDAKHTDMSMFAGDDGVMRIFIEARNAFGTGTHQTTRMILRRLLGMDLTGKSVLDCGCGTGILGIVALRLGANRVLGYDIDEWSSENAKHNAALAFLRRRCCRSFLFVVQGVSQLVNEFYQAEDHKCCDQEIDDRCDKITVHQHRCGVTAAQLHI